MSRNYKETLLLPKTGFPMKADLVQREPARLAKWESLNLYQRIQETHRDGARFVLHDGPPFANGDVHMGTALNKILKDLVVKSRTMLGFRAPFIPGWDCHGLPIEFKVVKESRGLAPAEVRRRSEAYARKYIDIQRKQFRRLGVFGDWDNPYLTLEPAYEAEVIRAFAIFVERGLVYQSKKPVYWSTGAQTALAEAEVEYAERVDPAIHVEFAALTGPVAGKANFVIWTTTPWTLPANVAIAVHPRADYLAADFGGRRLVVARDLLAAFQRDTGLTLSSEIATFKGSDLLGSKAQHPFLDRHSELITADFVTIDSGTGQVHVAPGHGGDDYQAAQQYHLPVLSPVDDLGRFTDDVGIDAWAGKYVFDANADVIALLRQKNALLAEHPYTHSYPHCWRSKTPVVLRAVDQFFIRIDAIRALALAAIDTVAWLPHWARNRIAGTVESRPDWCISRQRTWGVPLPVFYDPAGQPILDANLARQVADRFERDGTNLWFERDDHWWAGQLGLPAGTTRRNDTLDVWIDSGVSHTAVMRRRPELAGGPADIYLEATDQHRGWFQSSLMTSIAMYGAPPYKSVITHGFVVDKDGQKISKSSSYAKPMDAAHYVGKHGADIVRLWVASVDYQNEVPFSEEAFTRLGDAYRSFRNVLRVLLGNLHDAPRAPDFSGATSIDRWMLSRLQAVIETCRDAYAEFDFRKVYQTLNQFVTVDVSALYVDITKDRLYCDAADAPRRRATQAVMGRVLDNLCRLLAPILVFTADEAWETQADSESVHLTQFPEPDPALRDPALETVLEQWLNLRALIAQAIEPARQQKVIGNALEAAVTLELPDAQLASLQEAHDELEEFFILSDLTLVSGTAPAAHLIRTSHPKCARCWRHRPTVSPQTEELCERCARVCANL